MRGRAVQAIERRVEDEVVPRRLALVQTRLFREDADRGADLRVVAAELESSDFSAPGRGRDQRAEQPERRRLPGAVRTEVAEDLAFANFEIDAIDRGERSETLRQPL